MPNLVESSYPIWPTLVESMRSRSRPGCSVIKRQDEEMFNKVKPTIIYGTWRILYVYLQIDGQ